MKTSILLSLVLMCCCVGALGQTRSGKTVTTKTRKTEVVGRRAVRPTGSPANPLYSPAIVTGNLIFTSGQIGIDPQTGQLVEGGIEGQIEQVFRNLTIVLEAAGSSTEHILKATVFLADMSDYNTMNELYRKHFKGDPPARTTVQVAALPRGARIEIEAVAIVSKN
jgi:2-iminobutanoate/2-iminopropanoate deaminase